MSSFQSLDIASTGADLGRTWLDAVAHNIANVNTVRPFDEEPFRAKLVHAATVEDTGGVGEGVRVVQILEDEGEAPEVYDPTHPFASEEGSVKRGRVDLVGQMADMIGAQRYYQANLSVIRSSREAYEAALQIGR